MDELTQAALVALVRQIEHAIADSWDVRTALRAVTQLGYHARIIFVAQSTVSAPDEDEQSFEVTPMDSQFLRSLAIDPESFSSS